MSISLIALLLFTGTVVGFINALSAGGSVISIALYLSLGLPATTANATNRISILLQNATTTYLMARKKQIPWRTTIIYGIPTVLGAIIGSKFAAIISEAIFSYALGGVLLIMLVFLSVKPQKIKEDNPQKIRQKVSPYKWLVFFAIGLYGGFVQVGSGFLFIAASTLLLGYGLVKSNGIKVAIMFAYTIASLGVFAFEATIQWEYGMLHSVGNIFGAWIATHIAVKQGATFIRGVILSVIILTACVLFGWVNLQALFSLIDING